MHYRLSPRRRIRLHSENTNETGVTDEESRRHSPVPPDAELEEEVRRRIVGDDLAQLPSLVRQNQEMLAKLLEHHDHFLKSTIGFTEAVTETTQRLAAMAENHEARMTNVESTTEWIRAVMATMSGQINSLIGTEYERNAARRATLLIDRYLNVLSGEVLLAKTGPDDAEH